MKFFFPDSQDFVDPTFDFQSERRSASRLRARDDRYAHEVYRQPPFDGILVSKAIVDGVDVSGKSGKYSLAQRHRLLRNGVREFFRLDESPAARELKTMGDCGAFSYVQEEVPPYSVNEVLQFYVQCGFDYGVSVDHVILAFNPESGGLFDEADVVARECLRRQEITLELAREFKQAHKQERCNFEPVGVAQGWSPASYAKAVRELQKMGYGRIALGGMVPLKTPDIMAVLEAVDAVRKPAVELHLLGVTRTDHIEAFDRFGVTSFDTTSPFLRAFKDAKQNYFTPDAAYTALRIPQVEGNARVMKSVRAGLIDQDRARKLEQECLKSVRGFDEGRISAGDVVRRLTEYDSLVGASQAGGKHDAYLRTLEDRPWKKCRCEVCASIGVEVIIFRGSERNKRRGFHNLFVLYGRLHKELAQMAAKRAGNRRVPTAT